MQLGVGVLWGFFIVSDSGQYSAMVSELSDRDTVGTALTAQFAVGYLFTMPAMYIMPMLFEERESDEDPMDEEGWKMAFWSLTPGPVLAIVALMWLRRMPRATQMAGGRM
jgi:sugar phosphate permease